MPTTSRAFWTGTVSHCVRRNAQRQLVSNGRLVQFLQTQWVYVCAFENLCCGLCDFKTKKKGHLNQVSPCPFSLQPVHISTTNMGNLECRMWGNIKWKMSQANCPPRDWLKATFYPDQSLREIPLGPVAVDPGIQGNYAGIEVYGLLSSEGLRQYEKRGTWQWINPLPFFTMMRNLQVLAIWSKILGCFLHLVKYLTAPFSWLRKPSCKGAYTGAGAQTWAMGNLCRPSMCSLES